MESIGNYGISARGCDVAQNHLLGVGPITIYTKRKKLIRIKGKSV